MEKERKEGLTQVPHSDIFNDGGSDRGSYFIPKKNPLQNNSTQKIPNILSIPKKSHTNNKFRLVYIIVDLSYKKNGTKKIPDLCFNCNPKKNSCVFHE